MSNDVAKLFSPTAMRAIRLRDLTHLSHYDKTVNEIKRHLVALAGELDEVNESQSDALRALAGDLEDLQHGRGLASRAAQ